MTDAERERQADWVRWLAQLDQVFDGYAEYLERIALGLYAPTPAQAKVLAAKVRQAQESTRTLRTALAPAVGPVQ
jgi:hypothetical protein